MGGNSSRVTTSGGFEEGFRRSDGLGVNWPCGLLTMTPVQAKEAWTSGLESKEDLSQGLLENREERGFNSRRRGAENEEVCGKRRRRVAFIGILGGHG